MQSAVNFDIVLAHQREIATMISLRSLENRLAKQFAAKAKAAVATLPQNVKDELNEITQTTFDGVMAENLPVSQLTPHWITRNYVTLYSVVGLIEYVHQLINKLRAAHHEANPFEFT